MKKLISVLLLCVLVSAPISILADKTAIYPANIIAGYMAWAEIYGVSDLSDEFETKVIDDDTASTMCDVLMTYSSRRTLELEYAMLLYRYPGYDNMDMDLRSVALFAAIECGAPLRLSKNELDEAGQTALAIFKELQNAFRYKADLIDAHEFVEFYVGKDVVYSIYKGTDGVIGIIVD